MTNRVQIVTDLLFYAYVGIHLVRILVLDNYQTCPASLTLINIKLFIEPWFEKVQCSVDVHVVISFLSRRLENCPPVS